MHVAKLRIRADEPGLVPAGRYFAQLAAKLEEFNAEEAERQAELDLEDRRLEALYRKRSAGRNAPVREQHMAM